MNRRSYILFIIIISVLALLTLAAWYFLEIEPRSYHVPPSREARANEYLAFDRWLTEHNISVKTESFANISHFTNAAENQIYMQSSRFNWSNNAMDIIRNWIKQGGHLYLVVESDWSRGNDMTITFLESFGIEANTGLPGWSYFFADSASPDYDYSVAFTFTDETNENKQLLLDLKDGRGDHSRLLQIKYGAGKLTVSGTPYFLLRLS